MEQPDARPFERLQPAHVGRIDEQIAQAGSLQNYLRQLYESQITYDSDGTQKLSPELLQMQGMARFIGGSDPLTAEQRDIDSIFRGELLGMAVASELLGIELWQKHAHQLLRNYLNIHIKNNLQSNPVANARIDDHSLLNSIYHELTCDETDSRLPDELEGLIMHWADELSDDPSDQFNMTIGFRMIVQLVAKRAEEPDEKTLPTTRPFVKDAKIDEDPLNNIMNSKKLLRKYNRFVSDSIEREDPLVEAINGFARECQKSIFGVSFMRLSIDRQIEIINGVKEVADRLFKSLLNSDTAVVSIECPGYFVTPTEFSMNLDWSKHFVDSADAGPNDVVPRGEYNGALVPDIFFHGSIPFRSLNDFSISYGQPMVVLKNGAQLYWIPFSYINGIL